MEDKYLEIGFKNKNVLVTGGTGLISTQACKNMVKSNRYES